MWNVVTGGATDLAQAYLFFANFEHFLETGSRQPFEADVINLDRPSQISFTSNRLINQN